MHLEALVDLFLTTAASSRTIRYQAILNSGPFFLMVGLASASSPEIQSSLRFFFFGFSCNVSSGLTL